MLVYMNRTFRNAFEGIFINDPGLDKVKTLMQKKQKVVLVPIYRSFLDLSLILYSLYANNIDFPFSFGNIDDVPTVALMDSMLSNAGYISSTRSRQ
jgi:glycerol-3-phosphate O-acyltransferase